MQVHLQLPIVTPQERLALSWAVLQSEFFHLPRVPDWSLQKCREAALQLTTEEALDLLAAVPEVTVRRVKPA